MKSSWIVAGLALVIAGGGYLAARPRPAVHQPIRFNHAAHVLAGVDCDGCHATVKEQAFASLPKLEDCMQCHDQPLTKDPEEKKLKAYEAAHAEPAWQRIYRMPAHVYFSHRRHVVLAKVECAVCHGAMDKAKEPPVRPAVEQTMTWCTACHQKRHASIDCIACHR
jgi:hypothetical protein